MNYLKENCESRVLKCRLSHINAKRKDKQLTACRLDCAASHGKHARQKSLVASSRHRVPSNAEVQHASFSLCLVMACRGGRIGVRKGACCSRDQRAQETVAASRLQTQSEALQQVQADQAVNRLVESTMSWYKQCAYNFCSCVCTMLTAASCVMVCNARRCKGCTAYLWCLCAGKARLAQMATLPGASNAAMLHRGGTHHRAPWVQRM